jgi:hypothetical protein
VGGAQPAGEHRADGVKAQDVDEVRCRQAGEPRKRTLPGGGGARQPVGNLLDAGGGQGDRVIGRRGFEQVLFVRAAGI